jgi:hypothetical protein
MTLEKETTLMLTNSILHLVVPNNAEGKKPGVKAFRNKNQHVQTANQAKEREVVMQVPCVARTSTSNPLINQ